MTMILHSHLATPNTHHHHRTTQGECHQWKLRFAVNLHARAKDELERLTEYIRVRAVAFACCMRRPPPQARTTHNHHHLPQVTMSKLTTRDVTDLDTLRHMMLLLREVRAREAGMEVEMDPVLGVYTMLEGFLPPGSMEKEEVDKITVRARARLTSGAWRISGMSLA